MLHADGAPADWRDAIWDYNHAWWYVEEVLEKAAELRSGLVCEGATSGLPTGSARTALWAAKWLRNPIPQPFP
jgi:hypothetical protein